ncbi:MAG: helix-turn-helix domain-containing protein [Candidatus Gracilibacteria bacterium]|nr:helix-turn-helix domain-containing protein [Candidatus Gracilibacteria bacterium]
MDTEIKFLLQKLGLSEKETDVYLSLHKIGPSAASTIARLTKIKRTSVYDVLNSLLEKTLILSFKNGVTTYYAIDDVNKIFYQEKEKISVAEKLVKKLKESSGKFEGLQINYYKGMEGYREMYEDILRMRPKELLGWMHLDKFYEGIEAEREDEWTKERIKSGIKVRLLLQETNLTRKFQSLDKNSNRETRFVNKKFLFETTCFLYENHIVLFDSSSELTRVRIHHPEFYRMQKQIFEMNWAFSKKGFFSRTLF